MNSIHYDHETAKEVARQLLAECGLTVQIMRRIPRLAPLTALDLNRTLAGRRFASRKRETVSE